MGVLDGKIAVVTGAGRGIGREIALDFARQGARVVVNDLGAAADGTGAARVADEVVAEIRAAGGEAVALPLDLLEEASVIDFAARAADALGPIEVVVSNAGDVRPVTAVGAQPTEFARQIGVNLLGPQCLVHHLVPGMIERGRGDVVLVTSEVARHPRPHMAAYVASKAGLEGFGDAMRMELEGSGVRVGLVRPGPSRTEQGTAWDHEELVEAMAAWERWGLLRHGGSLRPQEVAAAVLAMVSAPRGTNLALVEVQPEAPRAEGI
jgi:NAD(P)-dependent dehydrogenase (short-subunit alcohol dehydrogenase family)